MTGRPPSCDCGDCSKCKQRIYMRKWWGRLTPEQRKEKTARRDPDRVREQTRKRQQKRRTARPELEIKEAARRAVRHAIERGDLIRPDSCERCGGKGRPQCDGRVTIHGHHHDYSRPLEVEWICNVCHEAEHPSQLEAGAA